MTQRLCVPRKFCNRLEGTERQGQEEFFVGIVLGNLLSSLTGYWFNFVQPFGLRPSALRILLVVHSYGYELLANIAIPWSRAESLGRS